MAKQSDTIWLVVVLFSANVTGGVMVTPGTPVIPLSADVMSKHTLVLIIKLASVAGTWIVQCLLFANASVAD